MFNVNADLFRATYLCTSTEETRYYLRGVFIEPCATGGATLVATDGHHLIAAHDASATCDAAVIVHLDKPALTALKRGKGETKPRRLSLDTPARAWVLNATGAQIAFQDSPLIDGHFPDWRRILPRDTDTDKPDAETLTIGAYNADYIATFGEAAKIINGNRAPLIALRHGTRNGPAFIGLDSDIAFGVLMPTRVDGLTNCPSWART